MSIILCHIYLLNYKILLTNTELCPSNEIFYGINIYNEVFNMNNYDYQNKFTTRHKTFELHWSPTKKAGS